MEIYTHRIADMVQKISPTLSKEQFSIRLKKIKDDINCVYTRQLDSKNSKSASQDFYTDFALAKFKEKYEKMTISAE